jgi:hypothetical protein
VDSAFHHFDPDRSRPLSAREKRILAGIENDLDRADHRLAKRLADEPDTPMRANPPGAPPVVVLSVTLVLLAALSMLMPATEWVATADHACRDSLPGMAGHTTRRHGMTDPTPPGPTERDQPSG